MSYRVFGGFRFYERAEVKDVMAYLRLLFSREDDPAFERVINFPPRGIGLKTMEESAVSLKMSNYLYGLLFQVV